MSIVASSLVAKVAVEGAVAAEAQLTGVSNKVNSTSSGFASLKGPALLAGAAIVGIGLASAKMAGDFQSGMLTIKTGAGGLHENIAQLSQAVLGLSTATGTGTKGLIDGLFLVESSGQRASQAINTLTMVTEAAKVGNADLGATAKGVTAIMTDFAGSNVTAAQAANTLVAAVGDGETNMQDLSVSMSSILPTASAMKIKLSDVMGAMATMTMETIPAADAATYLRQTIMSLSAPSKAATTSLKEIGLSAQQVSDGIKVSLPATLKLIEDHLKKKFPEGSIAYTDALKNIAGGSKQMQGILALTGTNLTAFGDNVKDIAGKVKAGGNSIVGWSDVQGTFNFKVDQAKAAVEGLMIKIGTALLPSLGNIVGAVAPVISNFTTWISSAGNAKIAMDILGGALAGLAAILVGAVVPGMVAAVAAAWPLIAVGAGITLAVAGILVAVQNWGAISSWLSARWSGTKQFFSDLWSNVVGIFNGAKNSVVHAVQDTVGTVISWWNQIKTPVEIAAGIITAFFLPALISAGVQATIAGGKIALDFIQNVMTSGTQAVVSGGKIATELTGNIIKAGVAAYEAAGKLGIYVLGVIKSGVEAVIAAGKTVGEFVVGLVKTGVEGWQAAGKLAVFTAGLVKSGVEAVIAGAKFTAQFVASIVKAGASAIVTAAQFVGSLIPSIVSFAAESIAAATTAIPAILAGFASWIVSAALVAAANIAAFWPIYLAVGAIIGIIALVIVAIKNWGAIAGWLQGVWGSVEGFFAGLWSRIQGIFGNFGAFFRQKFTDAINDFKSIFGQIGQIAQGIWNDVVNGVKGVINGFIGIINGMINGVNNITGKIGIPAIPDIPLLARGGDVMQSGWGIVGDQGPEALYLPQGARVIPNNQLGALASGGGAQQSSGGSNQPLILQIDGRTFARLILPHVVNTIRANVGVTGY